ncbi:alpha beta hydrolase [Fusarium longipes]|uniref:Alpha beta hydrolase n=1 Tax=Fusarium longipes TaxID=694270 RepID=A0A395SY53_9HYPO|nr:alpha beta hydrolase [Fusarium longipes]
MAETTPNTSSRFRRRNSTNNSLPLIISFHGSGDSCASWEPLADLLSVYRVLLWDRLDPKLSPEKAISELLKYLDESQISSSYVLVAHSYGGTFAKLFLESRPHQVAGMVLVETGQETGIDPKIEHRQYQKKTLGRKPLVVIRGNTLKWKQLQYEQALAAEQNLASPTLLIQKQMLDATDREDERLKKAQLQLSMNSRYVHLPDCGHGVIEARPDAVREAICWVMEHLQSKDDEVLAEQKQDEQMTDQDVSPKKGASIFLKRLTLAANVTKIFRKLKG